MPLTFLLRLQYTQLPIRVVCPDEIRHVGVLLATGLIEAKIANLKPTSRYASSCLATVIRITDAGHAELAKMTDAPAPIKPGMQRPGGLRLM